MWRRFPPWLAKHRGYFHLYILYGEFRKLLLLSPTPSLHVSDGTFHTVNSLTTNHHSFPVPSLKRNTLFPFPQRKGNISNTKQHRSSTILLRNSWPLPSSVRLSRSPWQMLSVSPKSRDHMLRGCWCMVLTWGSSTVTHHREQWKERQHLRLGNLSVSLWHSVVHSCLFLVTNAIPKHNLFVALNACPFPALASSCSALFSRQGTSSVELRETKSRFGGRDVEWSRSAHYSEGFIPMDFCAITQGQRFEES